jgi:hypothetical protein
VDDRGRPVEQAGNLPDPSVIDHLISAALAALSAGSKVAHVLGASDRGAVQAYRGAVYDLVLAPAGQHSLVIALRTGRSALRLALAFEEALAVQTDLLVALGGMGVEALLQPMPGNPPSAELLEKLGVTKSLQDEEIMAELEETPIGQDPNLDRFEALMLEKSTGQLQMEDADSFWETASGAEAGEINTPGVLSYEQAQKLGLLKPNERE